MYVFDTWLSRYNILCAQRTMAAYAPTKKKKQLKSHGHAEV